jgi:predicted nuclease with RNAse H fold
MVIVSPKTIPSMQHLGIDFGAKLAGTTSVCFEKNGILHLLQSAKKQDTDAWLNRLMAEQQPSAVFIDAPLSLPGVYSGFGSDYHFRSCDRTVGAMSPMFLGGLTARAMQLRATFPGLPFYEAYPVQLVRTLLPEDVFYKKDAAVFLNILAEMLPLSFEKQPENWHQIDAALVWLSGWRYGTGKAVRFGEDAEGVIWV